MVTALAVGLAALAEVPNQERVFGILLITQVTLAALALVTFPYLTDLWGMAGVFNSLAVLSALALMALRYLIPCGTLRKAVAFSGSTGALHWPVIAAVGMMFFFLAQGGVWAYVELIGRDIGLDPESIGMILALGLVTSILGAAAAAWIGDRVSYLVVFGVVAVCETAAFLMLSHGKSGPIFIAAIVLFGIMWNFGIPYTMTALTRVDPSGRFVVLIPAIQGLGVGLGPIIIAAFVSSENLVPVGYVGSVAILAALLIYLPVLGRLRAMSSAPTKD